MTRISNDSNSVPSDNFSAKFNRAVVWTASKTTGQVERLTVQPTDSLASKVGKVFAALLAAIVLIPCALIACLASQISDFLFGNLRDEPQANVSQAKLSSCCTQCKSL